jgi:hypothetical protein
MRKIFFGMICLATVLGCSSSDSGTDTSDSYDRTAMLTNWADNIIIPAFTDYKDKVTALSAAAASFNTAPSTENLTSLRTAWYAAYKAYQYIGMYDFGKAEELHLNISANTYPADAAGIEANITAGNYNLELFSQYDKQGFPGLDYLINGLGNDDSEIVAHYATNANAANYKLYLSNIITRLKATADAVTADWGGTYRDTFISSSGNSVNSSVNKTTNLFVKNLEKDIRTGKLGIPAGLFSNNVPFAEKVEAYYKNDISRDLLNAGIQAEKDFFDGKSFSGSTTGPSLKGYLDYVHAVRDGQPLSTIIDAQFNTVIATDNALDASFSQQILEDNSKMVTAYNTLQQAVIYVKLDMLQALNISIDYVDGDGD